jgi:CubicO group peptidase (beta-lactamase class C family)
MLANLWRRTAILLLLVILPAAVFAQDPTPARLKAYMDGHSELSHFSGAVLVVKDGQVLLRQGYGFADREWGVRNSADTKFRIASVSKPFTAVAILQLVERGKLSLDDPLEKYLPGFPKGDKITLHMMLTHTSGLANNHDFEVATEMTTTPEKALEIIRKMPLEFEAGTANGYSNTAFFLLSLILEKVSGQTYGDYLAQHVAKPAGLIDTRVYEPTAIMPGKARHYRRSSYSLYAPMENERFWNYQMFQGHGNLVSTVDDLRRFAEALDGTALLSAESKARMFANHVEKFGVSAGYGIGIAPQGRRPAYYHSGRFNGAASTFAAFPRDKAFIAILSNNEMDTIALYRGLAAILFGEPVELPYRHERAEVDPAGLKRHAGKYGRFEILAEGGKLMLSERGPLELVPESPSKFFLAEDPNRTFEFVRGPGGRSMSVVSTNYGVKTTIPRSE